MSRCALESCAKEFKPRRPQQVYCSPKCRKAGFDEKIERGLPALVIAVRKTAQGTFVELSGEGVDKLLPGQHVRVKHE